MIAGIASTRRLIPATLFLCGALVVAGCGGPMKRDELERAVGTLKATAEEGRLLAREVAADHTKATFVRVHAGQLSETCDHEAEKLSDAEARGEVAAAKARAVKLAQDVRSAIDELRVAPGDESRGGQVAGELLELVREAEDLEDSL